MPTDTHDSRTSERIEAFLEGPPKPGRKRGRTGSRRPHRPIVLLTEPAWHAALAREAVRVARYGRPATVMIVDVGANPAPEGTAASGADLVESVADAIRHEARETDHVTRASATRFLLLLPETGASDADHLADRLRGACRDRLNGSSGMLRLRVASTTPGQGTPLADALEDAERQLAD
jgi:PleD family two-component response regulator